MCFRDCIDCRYWRQETIVATPWGPQKRSQICTLRAQADLPQLGKNHAQSCYFFTEERDDRSTTARKPV